MKMQLQLNSPPGTQQRNTRPFVGADATLHQSTRGHIVQSMWDSLAGLIRAKQQTPLLCPASTPTSQHPFLYGDHGRPLGLPAPLWL